MNLKSPRLIFIALSVVAVLCVFFVSKKVREFRESFVQKNDSVSFVSYLNQIKGVKRIQLVELTSNEVIERTSEFSLFWNTLKLPDVVVQARVPTTYGYYIDLEEGFVVETIDGVVMVNAPALRASQPAVDVSGISFEVKKGSVFRDTRSAFEELRKTITPLLGERAEHHKNLAFKEAKEQLKILALEWVKQKDQKITEIDVQFSNEGPINDSK